MPSALSFAVKALLISAASARADGTACWTPAKSSEDVWGRCKYTTDTLPCVDCGERGICLLGKCFCAPGASPTLGGRCEGRRAPTHAHAKCKPLKGTLYPTNSSALFDADRCLVNDAYGAAVIPAKRWHAAQEAEARLWKKGGDAVSNAGVGDRAAEHVAKFEDYRKLPVQLGHVAEVGAGPWTQTLFALRARPDVQVTSLTVIDPGIPGYLASGHSSYANGTMHVHGERSVPVRLLPVGAEQVPKSYRGSFDTVVMINCVEHTFNAFATLFSAYALLRPGGHFVFHERSVKLNSGAQLYHPVRLTQRFFDDFLDSHYIRTRFALHTHIHSATCTLQAQTLCGERDVLHRHEAGWACAPARPRPQRAEEAEGHRRNLEHGCDRRPAAEAGVGARAQHLVQARPRQGRGVVSSDFSDVCESTVPPLLLVSSLYRPLPVLYTRPCGGLKRNELAVGRLAISNKFDK